jgi:perosamine synthetase
MRLHGMSRDAWNRYGQGGSWAYDVVAAGYKDNLSDLASALGLTQLEKSDRFHARRRASARAYDEGLADVEGVATPQVADPGAHAWHLYVLQVDARDRFIEELAARGIGTSVHVIPLHHLSHYRERYRYKPSDFPEATAAFERIVSLPIYPRMTDTDVARVIEAVRDVAREVRS